MTLRSGGSALLLRDVTLDGTEAQPASHHPRHAVAMPVQELPPPVAPSIARQLRFLIRVVELVPRLLAALEFEHVENGQKIGRRRLRDGRTAELWLVAKAPKPDPTPLVRGRE